MNKNFVLQRLGSRMDVVCTDTGCWWTSEEGLIEPCYPDQMDVIRELQRKDAIKRVEIF